MDMKLSLRKPEGLSPSDCMSDPEEIEVSDEDDDDRNHKHRRRETRSQSLERETMETVFTRPYKKHNKPFENGYPFRGNESQAGENWKNNNVAALDKGITTRFEKMRPGLASVSRVPSDFNQRIRTNQTFYGEPGSGRGRGRDSWNQRVSRFSPVDIASQMVPQGPITPNLFPGRGLSNVSNAQGASWNAFGLIPAMPNGGLETLHSIGFQGAFRASSLNMGIPRQRCRDFEERGFCLRGDMCPMEHGVNRIVVEDVQSLSQFNLPVSIPGAQLLGTPAGQGSALSIGASSIHKKSNKAGMIDDGSGLNGACSASLGGADLYDPDQPLWNSNGLGTSSELLAVHSHDGPKAIHSPKNEETESLMSGLRDGINEGPIRTTRISVGSRNASQSALGRIGSLENRSDAKEKNDLTVSTSVYLENETKEDQDGLANVQGTSRQGKQIIAQDAGPGTNDSYAKTKSDAVGNKRKPSQKALRTLFVNGIPQKCNKREALLSHFKKFGEVVDIYIPSNSERAFVQFSTREEAEAALRAPDAVMGNRFIKLWWANRDSIPDDVISNSGTVFVSSQGAKTASVPSHPSVASRGKDDLQSTAQTGSVVAVSDASLPPTDPSKPVITNGPKVPPPMQKKLELEQLKEELRKKQEMLEQKRNDFRRQLDKLEKHATGVKDDVPIESAAKRHKVGVGNDVVKVTTPRSSEPGAVVSSQCAEMIVDKSKSVDNVVSFSPKSKAAMVPLESAGSKQPTRPLASSGTSFLMNRYKLDNRPTAIRIIPPLPAGLANVAALKEYFSSFGDLSSVELEHAEPCDKDHDGSEMQKNHSARVTFATRRSAERAFLNGKCWQGNNLQFVWVTSGASGNDLGVRENPSSAPKCPSGAAVQPAETFARANSQEASASGNAEESENLERNRGVDNLESHDVSDPCSTSISNEESPKHETSRISVSGEEELKCEAGTTAVSDEKESPKHDFC